MSPRRKDRARRRRRDLEPPVLAPCPTPAKQRFLTEAIARREAAFVSRRMLFDDRRYVEPWYGYPCPCGAWHLTHDPLGPQRQENVLLYELARHLQEFAIGAEAVAATSGATDSAAP